MESTIEERIAKIEARQRRSGQHDPECSVALFEDKFRQDHVSEGGVHMVKVTPPPCNCWLSQT
jgi:hypothetical protein